MLEGPVGKTLVRMSIPMMFGIVSIILFNVVDTFYIGRLGSGELAAVSFTFPVVYAVMSIAIGMSIGVSAVVSRAIGRGDHDRVRCLTTDGLILALILVGVFALVGVLTIDPLFAALGATPEMMPHIRDYMTIWYLGVGFLVIPMVGNAAIRATGDTKTPSLIMSVAGIVNMIIDPFLIFGIGPFPRLELRGAALATVFSYGICMAAAFWVLVAREKMVTLRWRSFRSLFASWREIAHIGLPSAGTQMLIPLANGVLTRIFAGYGPAAVAAFGVGSRIEGLAVIGIMALATVITPFIGQNWGAGQCERVREAIRFGIKYCLAWGVAVSVLLQIVAVPLASAFSDEPEVRRLTVLFLRIVPLAYGMYGIAVIVNSAYNGMQKPLRSTALILIRLFVLALPLALLGSALWGIPGVFVASIIANCLTGALAWSWVRRYIARNEPVVSQKAKMSPVGG